MRRTAAVILLATLLAGCAGPGATPRPGSTDAPTPALTPVPGGVVTPVPPTGEPTPASEPRATPAGDVSLAWQSVAEPEIRPKRGFEHAFLDSERGALVLVRHLAGDATTIVATTQDGVEWTTAEVPSGAIPAGREVNGGPDWAQVVTRENARPEYTVSSDGLNWTVPGGLPEAMDNVQEAAVNGSAVLVCGPSRRTGEARMVCASSVDGGRAWVERDDLNEGIGTSTVLAIAPFNASFLVIVEGGEDWSAVYAPAQDGRWVRQPEPVPNTATSVGTVHGAVVAGGFVDHQWSMAVSADGVTWEPVALPDADVWVSWFVPAGDALVGVVERSQPEGGSQVADLLLTADGRSWRATGLPAGMADWQSPTFLPVEGGILVMGGQPGQAMLGTVVPAEGGS